MQKSARKSATLNLNTQFRRVYKSGMTSVKPTLVLYAKQNGLGFNRLGITVSKKIGKACVRNRAKRRIREVYRTYQAQLERGFDFVIVARGRTSDAPFSRLTNDFAVSAKELKVLKND